MEFATGAMSSLLPKLGEMLLEEYNMKESVKTGIGDLKSELESMQGALLKVSSVPLDQLDPQIKIWGNKVRELSYAIEDTLDTFMTRVEGVQLTKTKMKNLLKMARNKCTKFKARHEIAADIKEIESQVRMIKEQYDRYKINDIVANLESTTVDPRLSALYSKVSDLVGTDEPIDELMKVLFECADTSQKDLKIVSIVGIGGLGKTTLAKALYDKVKVSKTTYQCQGFVPVGQNQGAKKVLSDILFELDKELYKAAERLDERQLINQLQEVLAGKRFVAGTGSGGCYILQYVIGRVPRLDRLTFLTYLDPELDDRARGVAQVESDTVVRCHFPNHLRHHIDDFFWVSSPEHRAAYQDSIYGSGASLLSSWGPNLIWGKCLGRPTMQCQKNPREILICMRLFNKQTKRSECAPDPTARNLSKQTQDPWTSR